MKRLLSLLLTLAILLGAMPGLAETAVPVLHYADIASLKALAGDAQTGATWHEGMSPSASMNALQMWQWTDWFLSEKLRSLLGSAEQEQEGGGQGFSLDPTAMAKIAQIMGALNRRDSRCDLIAALRPLLSEPRRRRADDAMQLIKLIDLLPMIEELGRK